MPLHPAWAALALGDDAVFPGELAGSVREGLLGLEEPGVELAAQRQVPVLREARCQRKGFAFG